MYAASTSLARAPIDVVRFRRHYASYLVPRLLFRRRLASLLASSERHDAEAIRRRVLYCNRTPGRFPLAADVTVPRLRAFGEKHNYHLDLHEVLRYFDPALRLSFRFGDNTSPPLVPTIVKARPIDGDDRNAILFPLNKPRHYVFVRDSRPYREKLDKLVWRGTAFQPRRQLFLKRFHDHPRCDVGETGRQRGRTPWVQPWLTIEEQLAFKFVVSLEGNDVASNLKWILSSGSVCVMPRPRCETWFMEGTLIPEHHYISIADDYSDLDERLDHYLAHPDEAEAISANARAYAARFQDAESERLVALLVLAKYFEDSGQIRRGV